MFVFLDMITSRIQPRLWEHMRLEEFFIAPSLIEKGRTCRGFVNKNTESGLHFSRIRPRLWQQMRLAVHMLSRKFLSKPDETAAILCKILENEATRGGSRPGVGRGPGGSRPGGWVVTRAVRKK